MTSIYLGPNILKTAGDRDLGQMDHQQEMTYWDSNRHVIDDVRLPGKVKVMTPIYLRPIISTTVADTDLLPVEHLYELTT